MRDEKTNDLYGAWVDITKALGNAVGLKIEWTTQVPWDSVSEALKSGKIDAMCAGMWTAAAKAKEISFSTPLAYQAIESFVRTDDHRLDKGLSALNDPALRIAVIDNDNSDFIAKEDFPKAQRVALSQMAGSDGDLLLYVANNKADATFTVAGLWRLFDKTNPGKMRRLDPQTKLRVFGLAYAVDSTEPRLLALLNAGSQEIENSNELDKILDKANTDYPDMYIKPLKPFP
jgi:ABC-type amino acid transport substrate-binding protein